MSYRLNPYKILRFIVIVAFLSYAFVEIKEYSKKKKEKTDNVTKTLEIRKNNFSDSDEAKKKITSTEKTGDTAGVKEEKGENAQPETGQQAVQAVENKDTGTVKSEMEVSGTIKEEEQKKIVEQLEEQKKKEQEALAKKKREEAAAKKAKQEAVKPTAASGTRKYIQVATFQSASSAQKAAEKLGSGFSVQAVKGTSGKTMYRIISSSTTDPEKLKELEEQVKSKFGGGYLIRTAGK